MSCSRSVPVGVGARRPPVPNPPPEVACPKSCRATSKSTPHAQTARRMERAAVRAASSRGDATLRKLTRARQTSSKSIPFIPDSLRLCYNSRLRAKSHFPPHRRQFHQFPLPVACLPRPGCSTFWNVGKGFAGVRGFSPCVHANPHIRSLANVSAIALTLFSGRVGTAMLRVGTPCTFRAGCSAHRDCHSSFGSQMHASSLFLSRPQTAQRTKAEQAGSGRLAIFLPLLMLSLPPKVVGDTLFAQ